MKSNQIKFYENNGLCVYGLNVIINLIVYLSAIFKSISKRYLIFSYDILSLS